MAKPPKKASVKEADGECEKKNSIAYRVSTTAVVVALIAITFAYWKPSIVDLTGLSEKPAKEMQSQRENPIPKLKTESRKKRKLSHLNEYEDLFDTSAAVSNWDIFRPFGDIEFAQPFSLYDKRDYSSSKREFMNAVTANPSSFWARYGAAISSDKVAELGQSNELLEDAINQYSVFCKLQYEVVKLSVHEREAEIAACRRLAERLSFRGWSKQAIDVLSELSERYPRENSIHHDVGIQLLITGQSSKAKRIFEMLVDADPADGFAAVHLGFILKTIESDFERAVPYLISGIKSGSKGVSDGRFFYHLGDALVRLGRSEEADKWYEEGYRKGLFLSPAQRSLYSVANLKAKPWWNIAETGHQAELEMIAARWKDIRAEGLANLDKETGLFKPEDENLRDYGDWKQFTLFMRGSKVAANCQRAPITCGLIEHFPDASGCRRGQVKFSVMKPNTHIWPHTGPTNCRLRAHLGLKIPDGTSIRVGKETRSWTEGKIIVIDDSFEHEVWHNGTDTRIILIIDFWHPQLSAEQKASLRAI